MPHAASHSVPADDETPEPMKEPGLWSSLTKAHKLLGLVLLLSSILFTYAYSRAAADARTVALALKVDTVASEATVRTNAQIASVTTSVETLSAIVKGLASDVDDMKKNGHLEHERRLNDHALLLAKIQDQQARTNDQLIRIATIVERMETHSIK